MHTILLEQPSIFDRFLYLLARIPETGRYLPSNFLKGAIQFYKEANSNLKKEQAVILSLDLADALEDKRRYEKALKWFAPLAERPVSVKPKYDELIEAVSTVVTTLRENIFLVNLIINRELEPGDQLSDLLEDYYDGLLILKRKNEDTIPWEQVRAELDVKHGLS